MSFDLLSSVPQPNNCKQKHQYDVFALVLSLVVQKSRCYYLKYALLEVSRFLVGFFPIWVFLYFCKITLKKNFI